MFTRFFLSKKFTFFEYRTPTGGALAVVAGDTKNLQDDSGMKFVRGADASLSTERFGDDRQDDDAPKNTESTTETIRADRRDESILWLAKPKATVPRAYRKN